MFSADSFQAGRTKYQKEMKVTFELKVEPFFWLFVFGYISCFHVAFKSQRNPGNEEEEDGKMWEEKEKEEEARSSRDLGLGTSCLECVCN